MQSTHIRCLWLSPRFFLNGSENKIRFPFNKMNLLLDRWCSSPWMKNGFWKKKVFKNSLRIDIRMTDGITEGRVLSFQITFLGFFYQKNWQITIFGDPKNSFTLQKVFGQTTCETAAESKSLCTHFTSLLCHNQVQEINFIVLLTT
jgi:hypothetical protein